MKINVIFFINITIYLIISKLSFNFINREKRQKTKSYLYNFFEKKINYYLFAIFQRIYYYFLQIRSQGISTQKILECRKEIK